MLDIFADDCRLDISTSLKLIDEENMLEVLVTPVQSILNFLKPLIPEKTLDKLAMLCVPINSKLVSLSN